MLRWRLWLCFVVLYVDLRDCLYGVASGRSGVSCSSGWAGLGLFWVMDLAWALVACLG